MSASAVHEYVSTACQHQVHAECRQSCKFCPAECRCWCHSTCAHHVPYLTSENCEACGATPEQMVPDPEALRRGLVAARLNHHGAELRPPVEFTSDEHGVWSWRCNGGPGCPGWVGHGEHSETAAWAAFEHHVNRYHKEAS